MHRSCLINLRPNSLIGLHPKQNKTTVYRANSSFSLSTDWLHDYDSRMTALVAILSVNGHELD